MKYKRIFTIVIDSFGVGAMYNAKEYGDEGTNTFAHIDENMDPFIIPNLMKLGLGQIQKPVHAIINENPIGYYGKMNELSVGKDTMTGHWEMMGLHITEPFITFTENGFPEELIHELEKQTGHIVIGNKAASGTEILNELAAQEIQSNAKKMIVYTSADSVLQICGNEEIMGLDELYRCCQIARDITMKPEWKVGRVIARPYIERDGQYIRTSHRHDYALSPFNKTVLDLLKENQKDVIAIGKIEDIFNGNGITQSYHSNSSIHGMEQTLEVMKKDFTGLCFVNLVDFDAKWGHRRNPVGYGKELEAFDCKLELVLNELKEDDLLIICADHGNDPTHTGSDHTKEMVPLMMYSPSMKESSPLEIQDSFGTIGMTILENFEIPKLSFHIGHSILKNLV
ncbi:MAG: phosphopentomutase [Floccifex porci]|uniref:Phosphopentomutase n=1 Tax=Floccifex porci TaxID=2606629 RepID=A0A7X2N2L7_9FIRM|nr:phosphopentomutase [Floccifex porci]MCI7803211.1 phosphopentomutase [Erysipelotrichaceae bacterium]MDD7466372.1 phosphopentomutase [Floccifex porci]MSS01329.1 phosphopentomutase [Floccifex porci]